MKKLVNILCLSLIIIFTFTLVGCTNEAPEDKNAREVIKKYLNKYYTIDQTDLAFYVKMMSGTKPEDIKDFMESYEIYTRKFKRFLTDSAYETFYANLKSYQRMNDAYEKKCYVTVKDIEIEEYSEQNDENEKEPMLVYYYNIELIETSISDNTTKSIKVRKQITLLKVNDDWKIRYF